MEKSEKKRLVRRIRGAFEPGNSDPVLREIVRGLPKRYRDMIFLKIIQQEQWSEIVQKCYISERSGRDYLNQGLEAVFLELKSQQKSDQSDKGYFDL